MCIRDSVVLQGERLDFTGSTVNCIQATGGRGGMGANGAFDTTNAGGDGGPGLIQVHTANLILPGGATLESRTLPDALLLLPLFDSRSRARSLWFPLGDPEHDPGGPDDPVVFTYGGTDPTTGLVLDQDQDGVVDDLPPLLGPTALQPAPSPPFIDVDGLTLVVDASPLAGSFDDIYLRNPALLREYALVLAQAGDPSNEMRFDVAAAAYDPSTVRLSLTVSSAGPPLTSFDPPGAEQYTLLPRFFRVRTGGVPGALPPNASVTVTFQGTGETPLGLPDENAILVDWTGNATNLNVPGVSFVRFEVLFDVDVTSSGFTAATPLQELLFQRTPFRF